MVASMGEQIEVVGVAQSGMAMTSKAEAVQLEPSSVRVAVSAAGQTEEGAPEASLADVVMGQASTSTSPDPSTARGATPEELLPQDGSAPLGINVEPSRSLV